MKKTGFLSVFLFVFLSLTCFVMIAWADSSDYRVGGGDVLKVTVYDNPDLAGTVRVASDGTILFPLVGQLQIGGMTVSQVADHIAESLADGYLVNPQVSVFIEEFRSKKAVIVGCIATPGLYELSGPTTLLELISKAGGLTKDAGETVTIKRKGSEESVLTVDLRSISVQNDGSLDVRIMDGDSVFVAKAGMFYVTGEVKKPDTYKIVEGTTLIKAISMAGGFTNIAAKSKVRVIRKQEGTEHVLENVPMHFPILPDDVIVVPESFF
ncbi:MAG: SLBB domain-containing protein [Desulfuromonadaceae bacterium]